MWHAKSVRTPNSHILPRIETHGVTAPSARPPGQLAAEALALAIDEGTSMR
eukprot:COSAG02_NODE_32236_length_519_cov_1.350000_1_plen_50_part_10